VSAVQQQAEADGSLGEIRECPQLSLSVGRTLYCGIRIEMNMAIIIFQGLFELFGALGFIYGYFFNVQWLMVIGGIAVVVDDIIEMILGILNPLFPAILAVILAIVFSPWYVGVFWSSTAFKILGIPSSLLKVFKPKSILERGKPKLSKFI
jgi:hypothetical protein